jgi:predicted N-acetyltransferase YhbS
VAIEILPYSKNLDRSSFDCGTEELNRWLRTQASQQEKSGNTRTFLAVDGPRVVGYYATTTYRLEPEEAAGAFGAGGLRYPVPAVLLARLAVDKSCHGQGLGARLLLHAMGELLKVSRSVGFEVVVVHAIDEPAATFYARFGFQPFCDHPLHLFMPLKHLTATFDARPQ